jgi:hypothetical protein
MLVKTGNIQGKGNIIPVLNYVIKHYAMKAWRNGGTAPPFLTLILDGGV